MHTLIRVATWNIAGGRKIGDADTSFDYMDEDIAYFADCLREISPDIICLQESHTSDDRAIATEIAEALDMQYVYDMVTSPSHIDPGYQLSNAIISRWPLKHIRDITYPYPDFAYTFADGRPAKRHDKIMQIYEWNGIQIINTQLLPLHIFGKDYISGEGAELASQIEKVWLHNVRAPYIFCGDFNLSNPVAIFPLFSIVAEFCEPLPDEPTRPDLPGIMQRSDHILTSPEMDFGEARVVPAQADHYLCYAHLKVNLDYGMEIARRAKV